MKQQFIYLLNTLSCNIIIYSSQPLTIVNCWWWFITLKKQQSVVTHCHTILQVLKKHDQSSADQHFTMLCFYDNIRTSNIVIEDVRVFQHNCQVMRESHYDWLCGLQHIAISWPIYSCELDIGYYVQYPILEEVHLCNIHISVLINHQILL